MLQYIHISLSFILSHTIYRNAWTHIFAYLPVVTDLKEVPACLDLKYSCCMIYSTQQMVVHPILSLVLILILESSVLLLLLIFCGCYPLLLSYCIFLVLDYSDLFLLFYSFSCCLFDTGINYILRYDVITTKFSKLHQ